jgi:hypothetical protein
MREDGIGKMLQILIRQFDAGSFFSFFNVVIRHFHYLEASRSMIDPLAAV